MDRQIACCSLDAKLSTLSFGKQEDIPSRGWVRAIRQALGMSTVQMARRLNVSQPRITALEKAEMNRTLTLESLEKAAEALECSVVYALIPRNTLTQIVEERALFKAKKMMGRIDQTMALEGQNLDMTTLQEDLKGMANDFIHTHYRQLWDD